MSGSAAIARSAPNASITHALIGDRVIIHPGCRIGQDGFGYAMGPRGHAKIPQVGRVIIQDDVEIGASTAIDRGAIRDTVIGEGTKIDNLVQIGHNVIDRTPLHHRRAKRDCRQCRRSRISSMLGARSGVNPHSPSAKARRLRQRRSSMASCRPAALWRTPGETG